MQQIKDVYFFNLFQNIDSSLIFNDIQIKINFACLFVRLYLCCNKCLLDRKDTCVE